MDEVTHTSDGRFLKEKSAKNTPYFYAERLGIDSVAFILIDENRQDKYGVINERKPSIDDRIGGGLVFIETAFGGSNDGIDEETYINYDKPRKIEHFRKLVQVEAREESGFDVDMDRIRFISKEFVSTQMNQWAYLYVVNVTGLSSGKKDPQNAEEEMSEIRWKTLEQTKKMNDWKTKAIIFSMN